MKVEKCSRGIVEIHKVSASLWVARIKELYDKNTPDGLYQIVYLDFGKSNWDVTRKFNRWARREAKRIAKGGKGK